MGLKTEYERGRSWVVENLTASLTEANIEVSVFETNIRYLGGLLSIFSLTGDIVFKQKAVEIAERQGTHSSSHLIFLKLKLGIVSEMSVPDQTVASIQHGHRDPLLPGQHENWGRQEFRLDPSGSQHPLRPRHSHHGVLLPLRPHG